MTNLFTVVTTACALGAERACHAAEQTVPAFDTGFVQGFAHVLPHLADGIGGWPRELSAHFVHELLEPRVCVDPSQSALDVFVHEKDKFFYSKNRMFGKFTRYLDVNEFIKSRNDHTRIIGRYT